MKSTKSRDLEDWTIMTPSDWMNMTPSDWMNMTPSDWMNRIPFGWARSYGDFMRTRPSDWWAMMYGGRTGWGAPPQREAEHHRRHDSCWESDDDDRKKAHHHDHGRCRRCESDACECYCCIGDVDLAVYSRVGERRVIQMVIENERRRDAQVTLELSGWTTRGGNVAPVDTVLLEPKTFSLPACGEQKVTLVVNIRGTEQAGQTPAGAVTDATQETLPPDVNDCLAATADLRLVGCDHRPLRIAVAILPRDCDPYRVDCGCTCC